MFSQMKDSKCKQRVAVDMQFQSLMPLKDIRRIFVQLSHAYGLNRRAENPLQLSIVNFSGVQSKIFYANPSNHHWDVMFDERPLDSVFEKTDIVYLTADSKNVLQKLDSSKVYVIGGLLDHNSLKGHCLEIAKKEGYAHARLPIDEHVSVLTINQVFQVLLRYTENNSWKQSFLEVIPRRKGVLSIMERFELMNGYIQKNDVCANIVSNV
ncbi:unnamed protein product [Thelazia callipaeda]|uniref:tRNA (guanine(9)-N(1))-methyltransferase n=1 Tax=Thelazia callipaeda TaxID=103827 RepID=A0A0N5D886_THECL|nr:unnamed protein product [Thelazia callipaeda]